MNIQETKVIKLSAEEGTVLEGAGRFPKTEQRLVEQVRTVLLAAAENQRLRAGNGERGPGSGEACH